MKKLLVLLCFFHLSIATAVFAQQETCASNLKRAEKLFDEGKLEDMHLLIADCMNNGFNKEQKIRASELIIQAYLADENGSEAEKRMTKLIKMDPTYSVEKKVLSAEFVSLHEALRAIPIVSFGILAGPTSSYAKVTEEYGVHDIEKNHGKYSSQTGFSFGLLSQFHLSRQFLFDIEFSLVHNQYSYSLDNVLPGVATKYDESQWRFDIPVSIKYHYQIGHLSPFIQAGLAPGFVIQNTLVAERSYPDNSLFPISSPKMNVKPKRNNVSLQSFVGVGCSYRIKRSSIFATVRYCHALRSYTASDTHDGDDAFTYKYFIIDDEVKLHSASIMCGYSFSLYKLNKKTNPQ